MIRKKFIPAARFHLLTPLFDGLCSIVGLGGKYRQRVVAMLDIPPQKREVLDAGCGSGSLTIEVKRKFPNSVLSAVDADSRILEIAKKKAVTMQQEILFRKSFLQEMPFEDYSFDVVYSSLVFHHLNSDTKMRAMKEIYRVLKPKGKLVLIDFGQATGKILPILSWFTLLFEEGEDNYKGNIPKMLLAAGFTQVKQIGKYKFNIVSMEALKEA